MAVRLRRLQLGDINALTALANNINIWNSLRDIFPHPYSTMDAVEFLGRVNEEDPHCTFGIEYKRDLCGVIRIMPRSDVYRKNAELGYWIGEEFWNMGVATKAIGLITDYAFTVCDLNRIEAFVFSFNEASAKALENNGYEREGHFKQSVIKNEEVFDEYLYAKLR